MPQQICIITPCFNPGKYLEPCLGSVLIQGNSIKKHIVMDGGSTDGSPEFLRRFSQDHSYLEWRSEKDKGQSDALNKALALVDTEYFGWLNADDIYLRGGIGALIEAIPTDGDMPAVIYGDYVVINGQGKLNYCRRQPSFNYLDCLRGYLTVSNVAAIFRTKAVRDAGGFDMSLRFAMDYDLVLKVAKNSSIQHKRVYTGAFRIHDSSKTSTIQEVCRAETATVRSNYSTSPVTPFQQRVSKFSVALRMMRENCWPCRVPRLNKHFPDFLRVSKELQDFASFSR